MDPEQLQTKTCRKRDFVFTVTEQHDNADVVSCDCSEPPAPAPPYSGRCRHQAGSELDAERTDIVKGLGRGSLPEAE